MSIEKFKRMLKILLSDHVFKDEDTFFVHASLPRIYSKKEFKEIL